jgi:hypothetical protein
MSPQGRYFGAPSRRNIRCFGSYASFWHSALGPQLQQKSTKLPHRQASQAIFDVITRWVTYNSPPWMYNSARSEHRGKDAGFPNDDEIPDLVIDRYPSNIDRHPGHHDRKDFPYCSLFHPWAENSKFLTFRVMLPGRTLPDRQPLAKRS